MLINKNLFLQNFFFFLVKYKINNNFFIQKQQFKGNFQLQSLVRKDFIAFIKYILIISTISKLANITYKKIFSNQYKQNYTLEYFSYSYNRSKFFSFQKLLFLNSYKKPKTVYSFFELSYSVSVEIYFDILFENLIVIPFKFLQQLFCIQLSINKIFFYFSSTHFIFNILLRDYISLLGFFFVKYRKLKK